MGKGQKFNPRMTFFFLTFSNKLAFPDVTMPKLLMSSSSGLTSIHNNIYYEILWKRD